MSKGTRRTVVLINPRATYYNEVAQKCYPPMHLLYLAAALRDEGFEPAVLDANAFRMTDRQIAEKIEAGKPLVVGLSLYSDILRQVRDMTRLVRNVSPESRIVLGGPHVSAVPVQTMEQFAEVDYALIGEAERSLVALCEALTRGEPVDQIPGIVYRRNGNVITGPEAIFPELEEIPRPARDMVAQAYHQKRYYSILVRKKPVDTLFTSRGCPFRCGFCYNFRQKYRYRTPEDVVDELTRIRERGIRDVEIADDTFTGRRRRAIEIFDLILAEKLDISFRIKSRVDVFNEELAKKAREAGVYLVAFGMESGSQKMLDAMNKKATVEMNARACALTRKYKMLCHSSWLIGYPGETPETVAETLDFICKYRPSTVNVDVLRPYPNTDVYHLAASSGSLVGDWHPDAEELPWVRLPWAPEKKILEDLSWKILRKVYFRPYYVWEFAGQIVRNANWKLARYAWQEFLRAVRLKKPAEV
jgi:anaerobic magnesium-protoporphyrin IX monomethyl ester cyclase